MIKLNRKNFLASLFGLGYIVKGASLKKEAPIVCNNDVKVNLTITSNGKNVLKLDPKGNVGLGTAYPNYPLHIHFRG